MFLLVKLRESLLLRLSVLPLSSELPHLTQHGRGGVDELQQLYFASRHGVLINDNGGYYQRGKTYGLEVKLFVAAKYLDHKERHGGLRPVLTKVAAEFCVERLKNGRKT